MYLAERSLTAVLIAVGTALFTVGLSAGVWALVRSEPTEQNRATLMSWVVTAVVVVLQAGAQLLPRAHGVPPSTGSLLVRTAPEAMTQVQSQATALGIDMQDSASFARSMPASSESSPSQVLFALLSFGLLAAINTLVTLMRGRRDEFRLLSRIGAIRFRLIGMLASETVMAVLIAIALGLVAAAPTALGADISLLQGWPSLPWVEILALPAVLLGSAMVAVALTGVVITRQDRAATV